MNNFKIPKKSLIIDISNLLFRVAAVQQRSKNNYNATTEEIIGLAMHMSLHSIYKWYDKLKPQFIVFAFDGENNWRKEYTANNSSRNIIYKANRIPDPNMKHFYQLLKDFKNTIKSHTSVCCLQIPTIEADDIIAGYCQLYANENHNINIISGDKDFIQLLKLPNVKLINPDDGKLRNQPSSKDYQADLDYWLFLKCIRGDSGDNVASAYPKVRETKIKKAYENEYDRINFMNETWVDENKITRRVGDLFEENKILVDLFNQPSNIRDKIFPEIKNQIAEVNSYAHFHFLKFLEKHQLNQIRKDANRFIEMFTLNQNFFNEKNKNLTEDKSLKTDDESKSTLLSFDD